MLLMPIRPSKKKLSRLAARKVVDVDLSFLSQDVVGRVHQVGLIKKNMMCKRDHPENFMKNSSECAK